MVVNINTNAPRTKKFWCHYVGSDGNTPKRRCIELADLGSLMPYIGDTLHCATPLWYEKEDEYYYIYAQLSDKVAVNIINANLWDESVKESNRTDEEIDAYWKAWQEERQRQGEDDGKAEEYAKAWKEKRDNYKARIAFMVQKFKDYDSYLLSKANWIANCTIRAYEEVHSPILSTLQALRKAFVAQREEKERKRKEAERKRREEEERREAEEKAKEYDRLTNEAEKFKAGEPISGYDVVELCRRYGIKVHLRTVHNLQQVIVDINGKEERCTYRRGHGRKPVLDGCYITAEKLYDYLQTNKIY